MSSTEKKRILVICDRIPPEHSATGKIAYTISGELSVYNSVNLVCLSSCAVGFQEKRIRVYRLLDRYGRYQKIVERIKSTHGIRKLFYRAYAKLYYFVAEKKGLFDVNDHLALLLDESKRIVIKERIDTVISVSNPFSCHYLAFLLKQKFPDLKWYAHMMDSNRSNAVKPGSIAFERKVLSLTEKIFIMPALKNDIDFYHDFSSKICTIPLPIIPSEMPDKKPDPDRIICTYAGMFYDGIRNPVPLLELFLHLPSTFVLRLYSRGCQKRIETYRDKLGSRLDIRSFVPPDVLCESLAESDILINIGNTVTNQVPSKVYESIATGKPILNLYQTEADISLKDLNSYPLCKSVRYGDTSEGTVGEITSWIEAHKDIAISYDEATEGLKEMRLDEVVKTIRSEIE